MINPIISIVLGSYNRFPFLKAAVNSIRQNGITVPFEIIVIDGGSTDRSVAWLVKQKDIITIVQHNHGDWRGKPVERRSWGYFMNIAFRAAHGKYILMLSDDCMLIPGAAMNGYNHFEQLIAWGEKVGALAFFWRNSPKNEKYSVMKFFGTPYVNHGLFLKTALEEVGWIDDITFQFYYADIDLCLRLKQVGFDTLECSNAFVEHYAFPEEYRKNNYKISQTNNDHRSFMHRWGKIYNVPEEATNDELATYDYLFFNDPNQTVRKFPIALNREVVLNQPIREIRSVVWRIIKLLLKVVTSRNHY